MGNCCGKESGGGASGGSGNFKGQGRTLGDAPPRQAAASAATAGGAPAKASVPSGASASGPGRTLGEGEGGPADARSAAAAAAEARAAKTAGGSDKLSQNLAAQKKAGMKGALAEAANENRRQRENDAAAEARNWS
ncbi:uncharacterized protein PV09_02969 [Verruconis gallopava]|uniref:Uncharacterized protein n=1 Tax=Verruconis gallopava TaxID=253628 RepID=A0A0D2AI64_9PEZI|nr:uncharacterized protein PV09_02969 [Verruconis gallopava]KIW06538.1 hypothetical protein PV09_02969 [Verruconis gallopava]